MKRAENKKTHPETKQTREVEAFNEMVKGYAREHKQRGRRVRRGDLHFV